MMPDVHASMTTVSLPRDLEAFKGWARWLLAQGVSPERVRWEEWDPHAPSLFDAQPPAPAPAAKPVSLPREFAALAQTLAWWRDVDRWAVLYRLMFRLTHGERGLLQRVSDADVIQADRMMRGIRRDAHKMHAFLRFQSVADEQAIDGVRYVAYHKPVHPIVEREAPWFARRFPNMSWVILTPDGSAAWDGRSITLGPPASAEDAPKADATQDLWLTYYRSIFNPGRVNRQAMLREMPKKYWSTMPETRLIPQLLDEAQAMPKPSSPKRPVADVPSGLSLPQLADAARTCQACELCDIGTQVVFGEGPPDARLLLVGEQPGDQEDLAGRPFVGPAGQLFDSILEELGIDRDKVYLTNAVKHFNHEQRGRQRLHKKPAVAHQRACHPWLEAELQTVAPKVIVCLGATAALNVIGRSFKLTPNLGTIVTSDYAPNTIATYHPSAVLRAEGYDARRGGQQRAQLRDDLQRAWELACA